MHATAQPLTRIPDPLGAVGRWLRGLVFLTTVVVNGGFAIITNRITQAGTAPKYIGWGTGAGAASASSTGLSTEKDVDLSTGTGTRTTGTESRTTTTQTNDTYTVTGTRTATGGGTVTNAGLFDNATMGSGSLFLIGDGMSDLLASGDSIAYTISCKFS